MEEHQELINLLFQSVLVTTNDKVFCNKPRGERMAWVANTLRDFGYDTHPIGSSWGVLVNEEFRKSTPVVVNDLENN